MNHSPLDARTPVAHSFLKESAVRALHVHSPGVGQQALPAGLGGLKVLLFRFAPHCDAKFVAAAGSPGVGGQRRRCAQRRGSSEDRVHADDALVFERGLKRITLFERGAFFSFNSDRRLSALFDLPTPLRKKHAVGKFSSFLFFEEEIFWMMMIFFF